MLLALWGLVRNICFSLRFWLYGLLDAMTLTFVAMRKEVLMEVMGRNKEDVATTVGGTLWDCQCEG